MSLIFGTLLLITLISWGFWNLRQHLKSPVPSFRRVAKFKDGSFIFSKNKKFNEELETVINNAQSTSLETYLRLKNMGFTNLEIIWINDYLFKYIQNPTLTEEVFAVTQNSENICFLKNITITHIRRSVRYLAGEINEYGLSHSISSGMTLKAIKHIIDTAPTIIPQILKIEPYFLSHIDNPSLNFQIIAMENDPNTYKILKSVPNQSWSQAHTYLLEKKKLLEKIDG